MPVEIREISISMNLLQGDDSSPQANNSGPGGGESGGGSWPPHGLEGQEAGGTVREDCLRAVLRVLKDRQEA